MANNRIVWDPPKGHQGWQNIYRSASTIDPNNPPTPIGYVAGSYSSYDDTTAVEGASYYYAIGLEDRNGEVQVGDSFPVTTEEVLPRFVNGSSISESPSRTSATEIFPQPLQAGDLIVVYGFRRAALVVPAGWTDVGSHPSGGDVNPFCLWKISDGTETDITLSFVGGVSARLSTSSLVMRHDHSPIQVELLGTDWHSGRVSSSPLQIQNGNKRAMLLAVIGWGYAATAGGSYLSGWPAGVWAPSRPYIFPVKVDGLRHTGFLREAAPNENVSFTFTSSDVHNSDARGDIWLAITT